MAWWSHHVRPKPHQAGPALRVKPLQTQGGPCEGHPEAEAPPHGGRSRAGRSLGGLLLQGSTAGDAAGGAPPVVRGISPKSRPPWRDLSPHFGSTRCETRLATAALPMRESGRSTGQDREAHAGAASSHAQRNKPYAHRPSFPHRTVTPGRRGAATSGAHASLRRAATSLGSARSRPGSAEPRAPTPPSPCRAW